ncbi:MAG: cytochrome P450 [Myxococcota bacterium]
MTDSSPAQFDMSSQLGDPYPRYADWRRAAPLHRLTDDEISPMMRTQGRLQFGGELPPIFVALTHDSVAEILRDAQRFSSSGYARTMGLVMGHTILEMDPPEHGRYRDLIRQAFTRRALEHWERELVRPIVKRHVDAIAGRGRADLVREVTLPFPVAVIAGMIGVAEGDLADFHRWAVELIQIAVDPARGFAASQSLRDLFAGLLAERRARPRDDLVGVLARAELDGARLDDDAIYAFLRLLAPAGAETTYRSSSNLLCGLLNRPDQLEALRRDRALLGDAIEEGLRWESPISAIQRTCTRDTDVQGVRIPAGSLVLVSLGAANRDPARYERPDEFDLFRPLKAHLSFAFGPHRCLGMHLARSETRVLLESLLDRLPRLRLDPDAKPPAVSGVGFRSPPELRVVFDAEPR